MAAKTKKSGVSAKTKLARQRGYHPPEENPTSAIDIGSFMMDVVTDQKLDTNISELVTRGNVIRTVDGASHIDVSVRDANRILLRSGVLSKTVDLTFSSRHFRLAQNQKQGGGIDMTYEDRIIAMLRDKDDPRTGSRGKMTRAEFIRMLVKSVKKENIKFFCPELHKIQPIDSPKDETDRKEKKHPGLEKSELLRVGGVVAKKAQVDNAEKIIDVGYHMRASRKVLISAIMCAMDESSLINVRHGDKAGPDSTGLFQQRDSWGPRKTRESPTGSAGLYFDIAIKLDKDHPDWALWELITAVQFPAYRNRAHGSFFPFFGKRYDKFKKEARKFVEEYGATGGDTSFSRRKQYQFTVGPPDGPKGENYWEAITRLAEEVNWRAFVSNNTFYYCSDDYLIKQKPRYTISEETDGVESIDFDIDKGKVNDEVTVVCRAQRWTAPAGSVIQLEKCGPADGKWLVWQTDRNIFSYDATITLHRKQAKKKEPAPDVVSVATDGSDEGIVVGGRIVTGDKIREKIVSAAKLALKNNKDYKGGYTHWRPTYPQKWPSLFSTKIKQVGMDCSAFVEMVYMAAGAQDPSGLDYFGGGNTDSQIVNGTKTAHPQPGDLVFYNKPDHVAIYIGDGEVIGAGSVPTPHKSPVNGHAGFLGYWTYRLAKHTYHPLPDDPPGGNPGRIGVGG
jgi:cell wall-associated NlpC family hydrolase